LVDLAEWCRRGRGVVKEASMTLTVVEPPPRRTLAVAGLEARFPVNRVFCVGRNYAAHAREMGADPSREPPFFFMKPSLAVVDASGAITIPYPPKTADFHHEVELVVAIATGGANVSVERALHHVYGYAIGLDMTRRDLQKAAREKGQPWEFAKSFAHSAPIGTVHRASEVGHLTRGAITLTVGGQRRQASDLSQMIWSVAECLAQLSQFDALEPGDVIMTGTPEGVGPVVRGDQLHAAIEGLGAIEVRIDG
jgi:fumarylpyruvate hydrolase